MNKKEIDKKLIDLNLTKTHLAKQLGVSRGYLTNVINGKKDNKNIELRILNYINNK